MSIEDFIELWCGYEHDDKHVIARDVLQLYFEEYGELEELWDKMSEVEKLKIIVEDFDDIYDMLDRKESHWEEVIEWRLRRDYE